MRSYPGETASLDGGDPAKFTWASLGGGVYRATVNAPDPHLLTANGQRLYPYQSLADLQALSWGIPGFYANGTEVSVRLAGNADPNAATMVVSRYNHAFYIGQNFIYFIGLTFRNYGRGDYAKALYFNGASDNLVLGSTFEVNDLGIGLKNEAGRNVFEGNTFSDTIFDWPWDAVKAGSGLETGGNSLLFARQRARQYHPAQHVPRLLRRLRRMPGGDRGGDQRDRCVREPGLPRRR